MIVQDRISSFEAGSRQRSQSPAKARMGEPSAAVNRCGCFCPFGPVINTETDPARGVQVQTRVNGQLRQTSYGINDYLDPAAAPPDPSGRVYARIEDVRRTASFTQPGPTRATTPACKSTHNRLLGSEAFYLPLNACPLNACGGRHRRLFC